MSNIVAYLAGAYGIGILSIVVFRATTHLRLKRALQKMEALHES